MLSKFTSRCVLGGKQRHIFLLILRCSILESDDIESTHFAKSLEVSSTASSAEEHMVHLKLKLNLILILL